MATSTNSTSSTAGLPVAEVRVPGGGIGHQARAAVVVWRREMIRFSRDRARILSSLAQPVLFLFVLGTGLSSLVSARTGSVDFRTFLFPGVLATSVLFTAVIAGISMVWDREFGFLREMLVAPVSTTAILLGKCVGGATVATLQSLIVLALGGLVGVPYDPLLLLELVVLLFLMAFLVTAAGLVLASRVKQVQAAMPLVQLIITPLMFLSGRAVPAGGAARLAVGRRPAQPDDVRRRAAAQRSLRPPRRRRAHPRGAGPRHPLGQLAGARPRAGRAGGGRLRGPARAGGRALRPDRLTLARFLD